ncbi:MAG: hypothetical protein HY872_01255 [Chloroflexi bacterium]|nr:hypothetical protein [Chloroflexota bacterium]
MLRQRLFRPTTLALLAVLTGAFLRFHLLGAVPPGLHYDFAANAILANSIAFEGWRGVFITAYTGKEVLFFYSAALVFKAIGSSIFALQFTAAVYGVLGIAACYFAARQLLWDEPDSAWTAAFAAAILSFTFMHLVWSRYGERATTEPFMQGLAVGFLFRGMRLLNREGAKEAKNKEREKTSALSANSAVNMALAGAFTGLAAYTYLAARLFPIPIAIALVVWVLQRFTRRPPPAELQASYTPLLAFALAAAIVFAPLGWFFIQHPEAFFTRVSQLTPRPGEGNLLLKGLTGAAGTIFLSGEPYDRFNIPGRPIFGPLLGLFFLLGLLLTLTRLLPSRRSLLSSLLSPPSSLFSSLPSLFLLASSLTFLLPTALSVHDVFPSNVRSMGLLPLLTIFPAIGLTAVGRWLPVVGRWSLVAGWWSLVVGRWRLAVSHYWSRITPHGSRVTPPASRAAPPAPRLTPHFSFFIIHCSFFTAALLFGTLSTGLAYFNQWANAPSLYYDNDTDLVNAARWLNRTDTRDLNIYLSAIHYRHPTVAYLARDYPAFRWFTGGNALALPPLSAEQTGEGRGGGALYVFPHSAPPPQEWIDQWTPAAAPLGPDGTPDFRAYRFDTPPLLPDFIPAAGNFGNLVALTGYRLAAPGVYDFRLQVLNPPDRPDYRLVADLVDSGGYHWAQGFNDSYFAEQWQTGETILMRIKIPIELGTPPGQYNLMMTIFSPGAAATLPNLTEAGDAAAYAAVGPVALPRGEPQSPMPPVASVGPLNLIGFDPPPAGVRPGEPLPFTLRWQAASPADTPLTVKLGETQLESGDPAHGTYPTRQWQLGEVVVDRHAPRVPRDTAPGEYSVTVNGYGIGRVTVAPVPRQFTAPRPDHPTAITFGDLFKLIGYDRDDSSITLHWQALAQTDTDYTLFVHVLGADGQVAAQYDSRGDTPTSLWVQGQYVSLTAPLTASGPVEVGWYVADTGRRLKTAQGSAAMLAP